jgi:hypothetical protein
MARAWIQPGKKQQNLFTISNYCRPYSKEMDYFAKANMAKSFIDAAIQKTPVRRSAGLGKVAADLTGPVARLIPGHGAQAEHGPRQDWPTPLQDSSQVPDHR